MSNHSRPTGVFQLCRVAKPQWELVPAACIRPAILHLIEKDHPDWKADTVLCAADLNRYRMIYVRQALEANAGGVSLVENEVIECLKKNEVPSANIYAGLDAKLTVGEVLADKIAAFGGCWKFRRSNWS